MTYDLAKWATEARKAAGMTQEDFALELGFSTKASVNAIEKGRNKPTFETMVKISKISGFPLPYQEVSQTKVLSEDSDSLADDRIRFERLDVVAALGDGYINNEAVEVVDFVHVDKHGRAKNSAATYPVSKSSRHAAIPCKAPSRTATYSSSIPPSTHSKERAFTSCPSQTA